MSNPDLPFVEPAVSKATVKVGDELPELRREVSRVTLFMFGVAYWSTHRVHWDVEYARSEGFDDVLVTANLLSAYGAELVTRWAGATGTLKSLEERSLSPAIAGDAVTLRGVVSQIDELPEGALVWCDLQAVVDRGVQVVQGRASILLTA